MLTDTPVPGVAGYGQALDTANYAYQQALAKIGQNRQSLLRNYGYQADFNPDGSWSNMRVDGSNQYGQLQQMLGSQANQDAAMMDTNIGRGIHGGLAHQGFTADHNQFGAQDAQLGMNLANSLSDLTGQQKDAASAYNDTLYQAQLQAARDAISGGNFNQADYSNLDVPNYNDPNNPYAGDANGQSASTPNDYVSNGNLPVTRSQAASAVMARVNPGGARALAAKSAALNAKYGIKPATVIKNAYTNPKSKKRG